MYLFKNKVQKLKKYQSRRKRKALTFKSPVFSGDSSLVDMEGGRVIRKDGNLEILERFGVTRESLNDLGLLPWSALGILALHTGWS